MAHESALSALALAARHSDWVAGVDGLADEVERWEHGKRFRDAALDERARAWASPGPLSLSRLARHALAVPLGQLRWMLLRLPEALSEGLSAQDPVEFLKTAGAGWLREQLEVFGASGAELGRLLEQSEGITPGVLVELLRERPLAVVPVPAPDVWRTLNRAFPGQVKALDGVPLAVSPLSQLHRVTLEDGREVLFRVARPGVRGELMRDLRLAATLFAAPASFVPQLRAVRPMAVLRATARQAVEHTDLRNDALNTVELGLILEARGTQGLRLTHPLPELCSEEAVAFEHLPGAVPLVRALDRVQAKTAVPALMTIIVETALADGVFHADLRPEHLLVLPDDSLALVGCSALGRLDVGLRRAFLDYVVALFSGNFAGQVDALVRLGAVPDSTDLAALEGDLRAAPELAPIRLMRNGDAAGPVLGNLAVKHGLHVPVGLLQWFRALLTYRAITRHLVPEMPFVQSLLPLLPRLSEINKRLHQDTAV